MAWAEQLIHLIRRRGGVSRSHQDRVLQYQDSVIFIETDLATSRLWFSVANGTEWETVIDVAADGQIETYALFVEHPEIRWQHHVKALFEEAKDWPQPPDNIDPLNELGQIAGIDAKLLRTAIAHLETLVVMGLSSLNPLLVLLHQLIASKSNIPAYVPSETTD